MPRAKIKPVRLSENQHEVLTKASDDLELSQAEIVRLALRDWLEARGYKFPDDMEAWGDFSRAHPDKK